MALVLYKSARITNAFKALIAAEYSGVNLELPKGSNYTPANYSPDFIEMSPVGGVPVLETPDGTIFGSRAIARYVAKLKADNPLCGSSLIENAHIVQWMNFAATQIEAGLVRWIWTTRQRFGGTAAFHAYLLAFSIKVFRKSLHAVNTHLANNTYLVGHSVTLADIVMTCDLCLGYSHIMTKAFTSEFPHVERYFWTMVNQPNFKKVIGKVKQIEAVPAMPSVTKAPAKEQAKPKEVEPKKVKKEAFPPKAAEAEEEEAPKPKEVKKEASPSKAAEVLYTGPRNTNAFKALIAAEYSGVKLELAKGFKLGVSNYTPEFLKMSPLGRVPVLETPDGAIFESNAIVHYVANLKADNPLCGSSLTEYGSIEQWIEFAASEIGESLKQWLYATKGFFCNAFNAFMVDFSINIFKRSLLALNSHLAKKTYLVGRSVTLADIIMTCDLCWGYSHIMTKAFTSEFPHVERYFWTMVNKPNFKKVIGKVKQIEAVPAMPSVTKAPAKEQAKPKEVEPKKVKKEAFPPKAAEAEEEEAPKPKEVKKEASPSKAAEAEEEETPKPKPKNPLDLLPPSKMILDEWKRLYSNTKTNFREVAIKGFWDMYDPEGYSLWFCEYKYNEENTVSFVTMNKVGGFLQRMDLACKYAFGKMLVIGQNPPFKVKGLWLFRGQEIPQFIIDECYDMELYEWTKVDISDEVQKERVNAMIGDQEPFEGEPLLDAKCFK